ncbi:type II secretion system F family protein [Piscirickettsia salmonis]|uniref:type II secretion system F family protein n=1 Tax=Piscirickettsia salmonis TaxID=1238 RepID=UPI003EBEAE6F
MIKTQVKLYRWQAVTDSQQTHQGINSALNQQALECDLFSRDLTPIKIKRYYPSLYQRYRSRINSHFISQWTRQLATLLSAQLPLAEALAISAEASPFCLQQQFILSINQDIKQGLSLSQSLKNTQHFDATYIAMVQAGEVSGQLIDTLITLANDQERQIALKKRLNNALIYPIIISIFSCIITFAMLQFIVPQFKQFYAALNTPLPRLTELILVFSNKLKSISSMNIIIFLISLCIVQRIYKKYRDKVHALVEPFLLRLPIIGAIKQKNRLNTFCRTLHILFNSDHHLPTSLTIAIKATNSPQLIRQAATMCTELEQGTSLHQTLKNHSTLPNIALQMIHAGEHSHQLAIILKQLSALYESELTQTINTLIKLLEPLAIIIIGGLVGLIIIALYLPIFQLSHIL